MKLVNLTKNRPILVSMLLLFFSTTGIIIFFNKDFKLLQEKASPTLAIEVDYPGMDAEKMEKIITTPIEEVISSISGIKQIKSNTEAGKSHIDLTFNEIKTKFFSKNSENELEFKILELKERIDIVSKNFPREVRKPRVYRFNPDQKPILIYNFKSERMNLNDIREILDKKLKPELENIEGVTQVIIAGGKVKEILVACDKQELEAYKISLREVVSTIANNNKNIGLGELQKNFFIKNIYGYSKLKSITDIENLYIYSDKFTNSIRISDISKVDYSFRDEDTSSRINTEETVGLYVYKNYNASPTIISEKANLILKQFDLQNIEYTINYDESKEIQNNISNLSFIIILAILFSFYIFLLLIKNILFLVKLYLTILLSYLFFFNFLVLFDSIDIFLIIGTLLGLVYYIHFLFYRNLSLYGIKLNKKLKHSTPIDIKYKYKYLRFHKINPDTKFIFLCFSFLLLCATSYFFEKENSKYLFKLTSSFVLLKLILLYMTQLIFTLVTLLKKELYKKYSLNSISINNPYMIRLELLKLSKIIRKINSFFRLDLRKYPYFYTAGIFLFILIGLFFIINMEKDSEYQLAKKQIFAFVEFPSGTGFSYTNEVTLKIESKLKPLIGIKKLISKIESGHSLLVIDLEEGTIADKEYINYLKKSIGSTNPAFLFFSSESTGGEFQEFTVDVIGNELPEIENIVAKQGEEVKQKNGVNEVILRYKQPRDELALKLDEYKLLNASLNYSEVGDFLKLALQGGIATKVIQNQREMDVRVRFAEKYRNSERALQEIRIKNKNKLFVPLSDISTGKESKVPMKIFHKNKRRTLSYTIRTTDLSKSEIQNLMKEILSKELPENYRVEIDEFNKNQDNKSLYFLSSFLFLSYFIISAYYESFKKSIYTFSFILIILCFQIVIQYLLYTTFTQIFYNSIQISICTSIYLLLDDKKTNKLNFIFSFTLLFILFLLFLFFSIEIINLVFFILFNQFICLFLIYYIHPLTNHLFGSLFTIKE